MKKKFKFSIITPVLNNQKYIKNNLASLKKQTYKNFEHIVIDGGSKDNTIDIIKDVHLRYKKGDELNSEISPWNCIALIWGFSNQRSHLLNDIDLASDMIKVEFVK